jgi:hypothetical protein
MLIPSMAAELGTCVAAVVVAEGGPMVGFASQERHSRTSAGIARKPPLAINHPPSPPPPQDRIAAAALELDQQLMSH